MRKQPLHTTLLLLLVWIGMARAEAPILAPKAKPPGPPAAVAFRFTDFNPNSKTKGRLLSRPDFDVDYLLINFWAPWCTPCFQEMPALEMVHQASNSAVVAISVYGGETFFSTAAYAAQAKAMGDKTLPLLATETETEAAWLFYLKAAYGIDEARFRPVPQLLKQYDMQISLPHSVLVDRQGRVMRRWSDTLVDAADVSAWIRQAQAKVKAP